MVSSGRFHRLCWVLGFDSERAPHAAAMAADWVGTWHAVSLGFLSYGADPLRGLSYHPSHGTRSLREGLPLSSAVHLLTKVRPGEYTRNEGACGQRCREAVASRVVAPSGQEEVQPMKGRKLLMIPGWIELTQQVQVWQAMGVPTTIEPERSLRRRTP